MIQKTHLDFLILINKIIIYSNIINMPQRRGRTVVRVDTGSRSRSSSRSSSRSGRTYRTHRSMVRSNARIPRPLALKLHNFVERCQPQEITVANEAAAVGLFRNFTLSQCLQVSHYQALFEYYKINKVVVEFRYKGAETPAYTSVPITSSGNQAAYAQEIINEINPILYFKVDHNDITADSLATLKNSMRTREHQFTNDKPNFSITLKPAILAEAYKTAISTAYRPKWGQWLSTSDDTVPHYGLKVYAVAGAANSPTMGKIEVQTKIYFSCKCNE